MAVEKVKEYFKQFGMEDRVIELDTSSATVELAANALGCREKEIAKTMAFITPDGPIVILTAGDARIDNSKYKQTFHCKAKMIKGSELENQIGHSQGGVCPFAVNEDVKVYLDDSLKQLDRVYPAAGSSNSAVRLNLSELEQYSNYEKWVHVTKETQENSL